MSQLIDLTKAFDYYANEILAKTLQQNITYLRQDIVKDRNANRFIAYKIIFFPKTPIYNVGDAKTLQGDVFQVKLNAKTIYPQQNGQMFKITLNRNGIPQNIEFNPTYSQKYCVVDAIGILIAQQIRFNTLDLAVGQKLTFKDTQQLFDFMVSNYLTSVYKNWKKGTLQPKTLPDKIRAVVPWMP